MPEMKLDTLEDTVQQVDEIYRLSNQHLRSWLHKEILLSALNLNEMNWRPSTSKS
jgi:hypothetical protein